LLRLQVTIILILASFLLLRHRSGPSALLLLLLLLLLPLLLLLQPFHHCQQPGRAQSFNQEGQRRSCHGQGQDGHACGLFQQVVLPLKFLFFLPYETQGDHDEENGHQNQGPTQRRKPRDLHVLGKQGVGRWVLPLAVIERAEHLLQKGSKRRIPNAEATHIST